MILYLIYGFGMVTCTVSPLSPGLPHIYFLFTVRLRIFHVCRNENFRNSYLSFYWKKLLYIWYMALAWWLVPCLPFPGLPHIYFLFTVRLTNERVGVFLARRSVQHLILCWVSIMFSVSVDSWFSSCKYGHTVYNSNSTSAGGRTYHSLMAQLLWLYIFLTYCRPEHVWIFAARH